MSKTIPNEIIIAALLEQGTIQGAAAASGVSARTIYDRMKDKGFKAEYKLARADLTRAALQKINQRIAGAIDAINDIMTDTQVNPAVRLQAAQTILANAVKFAEHLQTEDNIADVATASPFDDMF